MKGAEKRDDVQVGHVGIHVALQSEYLSVRVNYFVSL